MCMATEDDIISCTCLGEAATGSKGVPGGHDILGAAWMLIQEMHERCHARLAASCSRWQAGDAHLTLTLLRCASGSCLQACQQPSKQALASMQGPSPDSPASNPSSACNDDVVVDVHADSKQAVLHAPVPATPQVQGVSMLRHHSLGMNRRGND